MSILQALDEILLELCETRGLDDGLVDYLDEIVEKARGAESESAKKEVPLVPLTEKPKRAHTHTYTHTLARARTRAQTHAHHTHTERESAKKERSASHTSRGVCTHIYPYHTQISVLARERAHIHAHPDSRTTHTYERLFFLAKASRVLRESR